MKEYEIVKEVFNPCAGDQRPDTCEILEQAIADPETYVREQYRQEKLRRNTADFSDQEHLALRLLVAPGGGPTELGTQVAAVSVAGYRKGPLPV